MLAAGSSVGREVVQVVTGLRRYDRDSCDIRANGVNVRSCRIPILAFSVSTLTFSALADTPAPLIVGVEEIATTGAPGPVHFDSVRDPDGTPPPPPSEWWGIAAGDEDATFPSTVVLAGAYGAGRVVAYGHEGLLIETDNPTFDNDVLAAMRIGQGRRL